MSSRNVAAILMAVFLVLLPLIGSDFFIDFVMTRTMMLGLAAATIVFLSAYGGMVSLAQWLLFGVAGFVEAGSVSAEVAPVFDEGVQVAVGGGVRYFSPVGPLRLDVGVPVNPRRVDDAFQVYISIGQAF